MTTQTLRQSLERERGPCASSLHYWHFGLAVLMLLTGLVQAQTASLSGTIHDPQGHVVPAAEITIANQASGAKRVGLAEESGRYSISQVLPGIYAVSVVVDGFKKVVQRDVHLAVDTATKLDFHLELGEIHEIVTVSSQGAVLNKLDGSVGNPFQERQISDLPLNSRNVVNLLTLQPGVTPWGEVAGARRDQSNLTLDGIDVNDQQQAGSQPGLDPAAPGRPTQLVPVLRVTPDSVQEFRVTVSNPFASQGRSSGGQVSLVTKSGTNHWHGSIYEYHRNTVTTANNFFNNRIGIERPRLLRNLFGGSIGGPIAKNRAFFFFNYEGRRDRSEQSVIRTVPLAHLGRGEVRYENSETGNLVTLTPSQIRELYPTTGGVNAASTAVLADAARRYPGNDPGRGDQINTDGHRFNASTPLDQNTYISRLDFNLTERQTLYIRSNNQWDTQNTPARFHDTPALGVWSHPAGLALGHTWVLSPTLANTFRYGITRQAYTGLGDSEGSTFNWAGVFLPRHYAKEQSRVTALHHFTNDSSWTIGNHTLQFGTNVRLIDNSRRTFFHADDGAATFPGWFQSGALSAGILDLSEASRPSLEHAMAAVLGRFSLYVASLTFSSEGTPLPAGSPSERKFATEEFEFYLEDSWQPGRGLTVNLGLRWGINTPVRETTGFQVAPTVDLAAFLDRRLNAAQSGQSLRESVVIDRAGPYYGKPGYYQTDLDNFQPRLSAAWSPAFENSALAFLFGHSGESVFRGGFAITYDRVGSQLAVTWDSMNQLGFNTRVTGPDFVPNLTDRLAPPFTGFDMDIRSLPGIEVPSGRQFPLSHPLDGVRRSGGTLDTSFTTPVNYSWNFSIGRELPAGWFLEASYLRRGARNLFATRDIMHPNNLVDPVSGMSWYEAARKLMLARDANLPVTAIEPIPFFENLFSKVGASGAWFIDRDLSPTQNAFLWTARNGLNIVDWTFFQEQWNNLGIIPDMFFHPQYRSLFAFGSVARSDYHGLAINARQRFRDSVSVDFNYTWSKSFDTVSGLQNSPMPGAPLIHDPHNPEQGFSVSDFDMNHIINSNWLWNLPIGRNRHIGAGMSPILDTFLGGWTLSGLFRWNSGLPVWSPVEAGRWNTNWQANNASVRIRDPVSRPHKGGEQPNFWADPQYAYNSFRDSFAGEVGDRNVFRESSDFALDFGLHKSFSMPYTHEHRMVFRWEVFNATNTQALGGPSVHSVGVDPHISPMTPNFGAITQVQGVPRSMQFGLRFEF